MSSTPHDALFKEVYGKPEHATGALRAVVPAAIGASIDWPTLARCPGSFVDPAMLERHTDLLFSTTWLDGGQALLYILFEHQSSSDPQMGFRMLRYLVRIWERWRTEHPKVTTLPVVIPVVLYHGAEPWSAPRQFSAVLDIPAPRPAGLARHLVDFAYLVDDLSEIPDAVLRARAGTALVTLAALSFKHARSRRDMIELMTDWSDVMRAVAAAPHGLEALALVMRYIFLVNDVDRDAVQALVEREIGTEAKDAVMTLGERLIEQGRQEGQEEGWQKSHRQLLLRVLRERFGAQVDGDVERRLAHASADELEAWSHRMLSAKTLAELLAD